MKETAAKRLQRECERRCKTIDVKQWDTCRRRCDIYRVFNTRTNCSHHNTTYTCTTRKFLWILHILLCLVNKLKVLYVQCVLLIFLPRHKYPDPHGSIILDRKKIKSSNTYSKKSLKTTKLLQKYWQKLLENIKSNET